MPINLYTKTLLFVDADSKSSATVALFLTATKSIFHSQLVPNYAMAQHAWKWKGNEKLKLFTESPDTLQFAKRLVLLTVSADVVAKCFDILATTTPHFLTSLKVLEICANKTSESDLLTSKVLRHIPEMNSLESINLFGFNDRAIENLKHVSSPMFLSLNLSDCKNLSDEGLECLQKLHGLKILNLNDNTKITNKTLFYLQGMKHNLQNLSLSRCENITNDGLVYLREFTSLQSLTLDFCPEISGKGLANLNYLSSSSHFHNQHHQQQQNPSSKTLLGATTGGTTTLSDDGVASSSIATEARNNISMMSHHHRRHNNNNHAVSASVVTNDESAEEAETTSSITNNNNASQSHRQHNQNDDVNENGGGGGGASITLKSLYLSSCTKIDDEALVQVGKLTSLNTLSLAFCPLITSDGISKNFKNLSVLENLDLRYCEKNIGDDHCLYSIGKHLHSLKALNLYKCTSVSDNGLSFLRRLPNLQYLNISKCHKVTDRGIYNLVFGENNNGGGGGGDGSTFPPAPPSSSNANKNDQSMESVDPPTVNDQGKINPPASAAAPAAENNNNPTTNSPNTTTTPENNNTASQLQISNSALLVLHVSDCKLLTDITLNNLHGLPTLRFLNIVYCDKITQVGKESLERAVPKLNISHSIIPQNLQTIMKKQQQLQQQQQQQQQGGAGGGGAAAVARR